LSVQDLDFHLNLLNQHREHTFALVQVGQFSTGGVGQFYSGANNGHRLPAETRAILWTCRR
jgi:hypothetical protein